MKNKTTIRSLLSLVLVIAMLAQVIVIPTSAQEDVSSVLYGDVNVDGTVNDSDVELLARYLAEDKSAEIDPLTSDVDANGTIDLTDLLYLVNLVKGTNINPTQSVTVTFETNGGESIAPITLANGGTITAPEAKKNNAIFLGWFTDPECETPFYSSDPILESLTVYAKYLTVSNEPNYIPVSFALQDQGADLSFTVERISGELEPQNAVILRSVDGSVAPILSFDSVGVNKWKVTAEGGYTEGASYSMTLMDGYNFEGKEDSVREASFFIAKDEIDNLPLNPDIIYIQDTDEMDYILSDGTTHEVLETNILYNSTDVITGTFNYTDVANISVGDTLCIYVTMHPSQRDYMEGNYDDDPATYIVVTGIQNNTVSFRGMSMQGENNDVDKLISLPSTIPFSVLNLPEGDGTVAFDSRDLVALYAMYGANAPEAVKVGDFLVFYVGSFGSLQSGDPVYYKKVTAVNGATITYKASTQEDLLNAINTYLQEDINGEKMLENIDQEHLEAQMLQHVQELGFAEDAVRYLGDAVTRSDEFYNYISENNITICDENGIELTEEEIRAYGLGSAFIPDDNVKLSFNITACDGKNSHFKNGIKSTLKIECEGDADTDKFEHVGSLKIEFTASFTQEFCIDVNINANADVNWVLCVPIIEDIVFSSAVDVMNYTGLSIDAKFYTQSPDEGFFDKLKNHVGKDLGEEALKWIEEFEDDYEEALGDDGLGEDIDAFMDEQADLISKLITKGYITEEQAKACFTTTCENHIVEAFFDTAGIMNDEEYHAGLIELTERYAGMLEEEGDDGDAGWLELIKKDLKLFDAPYNVWIFQVNLEGSLVLRANVNIALGANVELEAGRRFINWFSIYGHGGGFKCIELIDARFAFQFYAMGHLGLRAGILIEAKVGIISTDIGNVGFSLEMGVFAELYGYFHYRFTTQRPANGLVWEKEDLAMGALYVQFGLYAEAQPKIELLSLLEIELGKGISDKWTLLSAGSRENIYCFATKLMDGEKLVIKDNDNNSTNGIYSELPESFRAMNTLDLVTGETNTPINPWVSYYGYNFFAGDEYSITQRSDKQNFIYSLSSKYFSLVPIYDEKTGKYIEDYEIRVDVPDGVHYLTCDLRLVWCPDMLHWSKHDIDLTIPLVWTDLTDKELNEYKTATIKVGSNTDGYRTVWSQRFLKGEMFTLPETEKVLRLAGYTGANDLRYSGYTGYTQTDRGLRIDENQEQSLTFDTIYYFDMTTREYAIRIQNVQNEAGYLDLTAKYGHSFDLSDLETTGTNDDTNRIYTAFNGIEVKNGDVILQCIDSNTVIDDYYASQLLNGNYTYHAKYVDNSVTVTYKFTGIALDPITKIYKKGNTAFPSSDYDSHIKEANGNAYASKITPTLSPLSSDVVYSVTVTIPPQPLKKYSITFESNGGSKVNPITAEERSVIASPTEPTKAGHTFAGWYYDQALTQEMDWSRSMPSMNFTLYADWGKNTYTITFNPGEGSTSVTSIPVVYGQELGTLPTANRTNYIFLGWYDDQGNPYTKDTVYEVADNITLHAEWQLKAPIEITVNHKTATYNGSGIPINFIIKPLTPQLEDVRLKAPKPDQKSVIPAPTQNSFTVSYKLQNSNTWSTTPPVNAGTYDVRIERAEDNHYQEFNQTYSGILTINKKDRTIYENLLAGQVCGYTNILVTNGITYEGDGTPKFGLKVKGNSSWFKSPQTSEFFKDLPNGTYQIWFYIAATANYKELAVKLDEDFTVKAPTQSSFGAASYVLSTTTSGKTWADTTDPVYAKLMYTTGGSGSEKQVSNTRWLGQTGEDTLPAPSDPWLIKNIYYRLAGSNAWRCSAIRLDVFGKESSVAHFADNNSDGLFVLEDASSKTISTNSAFERKITSVGTFTSSVTLSLSAGSGFYTYTYDGKVVDNYKDCTSGGYYNAYYHTHAPTMSISCSSSAYNSYFQVLRNTVTIDRDGLYEAMRSNGITSLTATATLTFDTTSTASGNTWKKNFTINLSGSSSGGGGGIGDSTFQPIMKSMPSVANSNISIQEHADYLYVTMGLKRNPGIWGMKNSVTFDKSKLELVSTAEGTLTSAYVVKATTNDNKYTFLAYCDDITESYATGDFVTLVFKKKVAEVNTDVDLTLTTNQAIDDKGQVVDVEGRFYINESNPLPPMNTYDTTPETIINTLSNMIRTRNSDEQVFYYQADTRVTEETLSAWFRDAKKQLERYDQYSTKSYCAAATQYTKDNLYYYVVTYEVEFYMTPEQEEKLDDKITEILTSLNVFDKSTLEKIVAVYKYICENVAYSENAADRFTAYGALVNGESVCQGYALAIMLLLNELGVENDVILGASNEVNHMWNIVNLDGEYFLMDATWDSARAEPCYAWFLKGSNHFTDHTPTSAYTVPVSGDDYKMAFELSHSYADWTQDETSHWHTCKICQETNHAAEHTVVIDEAVAPTCTEAGLTEGSHCSVCNAIIKTQTDIPAAGHDHTSTVTTAATCTQDGVMTYTCSKCSHSYTEAIDATGHTVVIDEAVASTCTTEGKAEGSHCSVCNVVLVPQEPVPALGHDYGYTDNGDNTHTRACSRCEIPLTENHTFANGSCICGAKEIGKPIVDVNIKIYHTLDLTSDISITFAIPMSALASYDSYYLECVLPEYEGNKLTGSFTIKIEPVVSGNYYYFTLTGITAVRIGDMVDAVLHMVKDGTEYISQTDTYSVATYAYAMLNNSGNSKMLTLCADLLRYGAEAQSYKGYRTDALVDAAMTDEQKAYFSDTEALTFTATDFFLSDIESPSITWVGKTLVLGSKVGLKFVFDAANYSGDISNLSMKVFYISSNGELKIVTLTGAEIYSAANHYYSFTFYGLLASELRIVMDVAIFEGDTQLSECFRYSAESYASNMITGALASLCKALFAYSDSAKAFFAK